HARELLLAAERLPRRRQLGGWPELLQLQALLVQHGADRERHHAHGAGDRPQRRRLRLLLDHEERAVDHDGAAHDDHVDDHEQHDEHHQHHDVHDHQQHDHVDDDQLDQQHDAAHGAAAATDDHLDVDDHPVHVVHHVHHVNKQLHHH